MSASESSSREPSAEKETVQSEEAEEVLIVPEDDEEPRAQIPRAQEIIKNSRAIFMEMKTNQGDSVYDLSMKQTVALCKFS